MSAPAQSDQSPSDGNDHADADVVSKTADSNNAKQCMACIYATTEWPVADNCRSDCADSGFLGSPRFTDCDEGRSDFYECQNDVQLEAISRAV